MDYAGFSVPYYNIPSNNRELQRVDWRRREFSIITYQVITGNYSAGLILDVILTIITYQVITGNYSQGGLNLCILQIITYQVITGNYSTPNQWK